MQTLLLLSVCCWQAMTKTDDILLNVIQRKLLKVKVSDIWCLMYVPRDFLLQRAKEELGDIKERMKEITELSGKLAVHFCENEQNFKLEEFLCIMKCFCEKVQHCQKVSTRVSRILSDFMFTR